MTEYQREQESLGLLANVGYSWLFCPVIMPGGEPTVSAHYAY